MRHYIRTEEFSVEELNELLKTANKICKNPKKYANKLKGKKLATLFYEPSTRTRLSFESAMLDLGGSVIGFSDASNTSASKGESVADTTKIINCYADVIAMRHYLEGAPYVSSLNSNIPVINAGDGSHCHPTQTLADLFTIYRKRGELSGITVGLCGDLKNGRTVHSLIEALSRYKNIHFVLIAPDELALPGHIEYSVPQELNIKFTKISSLDEAIPMLDVLYMTRIQRERFDDIEEYERLKDSYILTADKLKTAKEDMIVLHPLPRVNEISVAVDADPRAYYFEQARCGKFMRMALILKLLKEKNKAPRYTVDVTSTDGVCKNPKCITTTEQELCQKFYTDEKGVERCIYCDSAK